MERLGLRYHAHKSAVLLAGAKSRSGARGKGWKIVVNASVEPELWSAPPGHEQRVPRAVSERT
jgi:hypothetical protein